MSRPNLLNDPWFDALYTDGSTKSVGLGQAFEDLHEIYDVGEADPLLRVAIRRLLFAIDLAGGMRYLEGQAERFSLEGATPFFSTTGLADRYPEFIRSEAQLALFAAQKGSTLLDQRTSGADSAASVSWRRVLVDLLVHQSWAPGGLLSAPKDDGSIYKSAVGAPLSNRVSAWVVGPDLFTAFGIMSSILTPIPQGDKPTWALLAGSKDERGAPGGLPRARPVRGPIDALTWVPRRVELLGTAQGCSQVVVFDGDRPSDGWGDLPDMIWVGSGGRSIPAAISPGQGLEGVLCLAGGDRLAQAVVTRGLSGHCFIEVTGMPHKQKAIHGSCSGVVRVLDATSLHRCQALGELDRQLDRLPDLGEGTASTRAKALRGILEEGCSEDSLDAYVEAVLGAMRGEESWGSDPTAVEEEHSWSENTTRRALRLIDKAVSTGFEGEVV